MAIHIPVMRINESGINSFKHLLLPPPSRRFRPDGEDSVVEIEGEKDFVRMKLPIKSGGATLCKNK